MNLTDEPKSGISPACLELLYEAMSVDLNGIILIRKNFMFHNIINRAYMLGCERGAKIKRYTKDPEAAVKELNSVPAKPAGPICYVGQCPKCKQTLHATESEVVLAGSPPEFPTLIAGHCGLCVDMVRTSPKTQKQPYKNNSND